MLVSVDSVQHLFKLMNFYMSINQHVTVILLCVLFFSPPTATSLNTGTLSSSSKDELDDTGVLGLSPYVPYQMQGHASSENFFLTYDAASNRLGHSHGQTIRMGLVTKPVMIQQGDDITTFRYGLSARRFFRKHADGSKTYYLHDGRFEYRLPAPGNAASPRSVVRLANGYSPIAQVELVPDKKPQYTYFVQDVLNSPVCGLDSTGGVLFRVRFDSWGGRTDANGLPATLEREVEDKPSFTGHEAIVTGNLIHMNARLYDPVMSAFLGPDSVMQGRSIASVNRLIYGHHNPTTFVDPSGHFFEPPLRPGVSEGRPRLVRSTHENLSMNWVVGESNHNQVSQHIHNPNVRVSGIHNNQHVGFAAGFKQDGDTLEIHLAHKGLRLESSNVAASSTRNQVLGSRAANSTRLQALINDKIMTQILEEDIIPYGEASFNGLHRNLRFAINPTERLDSARNYNRVVQKALHRVARHRNLEYSRAGSIVTLSPRVTSGAMP